MTTLKRMERLTERNNGANRINCDNCGAKGNCIIPNTCLCEITDRLAAYEDAEEQGRLVILPEMLYEADTTPLVTGIIKWKVTGMLYYDWAVQSYTVQTETTQAIISGCEIGKTVFLSREEAEAALKGETKDV